MKFIARTRSLTIIIFCIVFSSAGKAQQMWNTGLTSKEISIEYLKPTFSEGVSGSAISGNAVNITGRINVGERKIFIVSLPYYQVRLRFNFASSSNNYSEETFGNLYLGLESRKENAPFTTNFGITLPTIPDDKILTTLIGTTANPDNYEGAFPNAIILSFRGNYYRNEQQGLGTITRFGVSGFIRTKTSGTLSSNDSFEALLNYAFQIKYSSETVNALIGFSGKLLLTEKGDISDRILHQFGMATSYKAGFLRPEVFIRIPINKSLSDIIENTYGLSLTMEI